MCNLVTRQQIAQTLNVHVTQVNDAFRLAEKEHPELSSKHKLVDYTLEQTLLAMSYYRDGKGASSLEIAMIKDDFTMRPEVKAVAIGIEGTEEFMERVKRYPKLHCCATCSFCTKATIKNNKPVLYPYCLLHERYLHLLNRRKGKRVDVYKDYCKQWEYSNKEPLIFYTADSPTNKDIYGNVKNEVMGFDSSHFGVSGSKEVRLVTDVGLDDSLIN